MPTVVSIWDHKHYCQACNSYWVHHDSQDCFELNLYPDDYPCPICEDSGDPEVREFL